MIALPRTLATASVALLACGCSSGDRERPGIPPRIVLLVSVAGLRADHTSMHLYPQATTDVWVDGGQRALGRDLGLDDLAAEGVLFANAFAASADPLVSLAALHTARSPVQTGVLGAGGAPELSETTLAEGLAAAGFDTVAFVTHAGEALGPGWRQGFERFEQNDQDVRTLGRAITWIGEVDFGRDKPLFVWLHLEGPRFPFDPPSLPGEGGRLIDYARLFTDPAYDGPATGGHEFRRRARAEGMPLSDADREHITALYDGEVALTTQLLYRFFDFLRYVGAPAGAWDRTLLVFAGTGGVCLPRTAGEANWGEETGLVDGNLRVPLFLRHPDSLTGRRIFDDPVDLQDVAPTLWDWFAAPVGHRSPGSTRRGAPWASSRSLLALTDSYVHRPFPQRPIFAVAPGGAGASVRHEGWRLVQRERANGEPELSLFHAAVDPRSLRDEASAEPERVAELRALLEELRGRLP